MPWPEAQYPFQQDPFTLLLAHFENLEKADYAVGYESFGGMGYLPAKGYHGTGFDLERNFLHENFYTQT